MSPTKTPMTGTEEKFEIFLAAPPGLEEVLAAEVGRKGFRQPKVVPGGVATMGGWPDVWRANLWLRGASKVLARIDQFRAVHFAQLDDRARAVDWKSLLRPDVAFRVEASCAASKLWHSGAVAQRVATAIRESVGAKEAEDAPVVIRARMEKDLCTISVDTSGDLLHKRGFKQAVNPAPMRETMAALFLMQCGYEGTETLLDPMCGAGTFVIEGAEMAARLNPGRARDFAFEHLRSFDAEAWARMRAVARAGVEGVTCLGFDRDAGAVAMSIANAERAGVAAGTRFAQGTISDLQRPDGAPGLVIVNPPYGSRIGDRKSLGPLYRALGQVLMSRFAGWRVGLVAAEPALARETRLPFLPPGPPVPHGGMRVTLFRTAPLG